jgi:hypothetical protein
MAFPVLPRPSPVDEQQYVNGFGVMNSRCSSRFTLAKQQRKTKSNYADQK